MIYQVGIYQWSANFVKFISIIKYINLCIFMLLHNVHFIFPTTV